MVGVFVFWVELFVVVGGVGWFFGIYFVYWCICGDYFGGWCGVILVWCRYGILELFCSVFDYLGVGW